MKAVSLMMCHRHTVRPPRSRTDPFVGVQPSFLWAEGERLHSRYPRGCTADGWLIQAPADTCSVHICQQNTTSPANTETHRYLCSAASQTIPLLHPDKGKPWRLHVNGLSPHICSFRGGICPLPSTEALSALVDNVRLCSGRADPGHLSHRASILLIVLLPICQHLRSHWLQ